MKNSATTKNIKQSFNQLAQSLGCKARLAGNAKSPKFQELIGESVDGYEIVVGITANRFGQLINNYPALQQ